MQYRYTYSSNMLDSFKETIDQQVFRQAQRIEDLKAKKGAKAVNQKEVGPNGLKLVSEIELVTPPQAQSVSMHPLKVVAKPPLVERPPAQNQSMIRYQNLSMINKK